MGQRSTLLGQMHLVCDRTFMWYTAGGKRAEQIEVVWQSTHEDYDGDHAVSVTVVKAKDGTRWQKQFKENQNYQKGDILNIIPYENGWYPHGK